MPVIVVKSERLHYRLEGPPDAPVVLLANSLGTALGMWDGQMPELLRRFRVLRYDMRGHGASSVPEKQFDVPELGLDVTALLDALGLTRVNYAGLSLGGVVGLWLGARAPERLNKLALCNTAPSFGPKSLWDARIDAVSRGGMSAIAETVLERWFTSEFREREPTAVERMRQMLLGTPLGGYVPACRALRDVDLHEAAAEVRVPTLVVAGKRDRATPPAEGRWLAQQIAGARYLELPVAHLSNIEAAAGFTAALLDFFLD